MLMMNISSMCIDLLYSRESKVGKCQPLHPKGIQLNFVLLQRQFHGVFEPTLQQTRSTCITPEQYIYYGSPTRTWGNIMFRTVINVNVNDQD